MPTCWKCGRDFTLDAGEVIILDFSVERTSICEACQYEGVLPRPELDLSKIDFSPAKHQG